MKAMKGGTDGGGFLWSVGGDRSDAEDASSDKVSMGDPG